MDANNQPLTTDQRGTSFNRKVGNAVDIGAFESSGFMLAATSGRGQVTAGNTAFPDPLVVTVTANQAAEPVVGGRVTFTAPANGASASVADGTATSGTVTANGIPSFYAVTATASGAPGSASFSLTNTCPTITVTNPATTTGTYN